MLAKVKLSSRTWQQKIKKKQRHLSKLTSFYTDFPASLHVTNYCCLNKSYSEIQSRILVVVWYELFNYIKSIHVCTHKQLLCSLTKRVCSLNGIKLLVFF